MSQRTVEAWGFRGETGGEKEGGERKGLRDKFYSWKEFTRRQPQYDRLPHAPLILTVPRNGGNTKNVSDLRDQERGSE